MDIQAITTEEKAAFKAGYEIHRKIQDGSLSIFILSDEQSEVLGRGMGVVNKYFDPDEVMGDMPDDTWEWLKDRI